MPTAQTPLESTADHLLARTALLAARAEALLQGKLPTAPLLPSADPGADPLARAEADAFGQGGTTAESLARYELARHNDVERIQKAAQDSLTWFEQVRRHRHRPRRLAAGPLHRDPAGPRLQRSVHRARHEPPPALNAPATGGAETTPDLVRRRLGLAVGAASGHVSLESSTAPRVRKTPRHAGPVGCGPGQAPKRSWPPAASSRVKPPQANWPTNGPGPGTDQTPTQV